MATIKTMLRILFTPAAAVMAAVLCALFLYMAERAIAHMPFVLMSTLGLSALLFLFCRRLYFSIYTALGVSVLLTAASVVKYRNKGFDLHIYDVVFTGTDASAFSFLLSEFTVLIVPVALALLCSLLCLGFMFSKDKKPGLR